MNIPFWKKIFSFIYPIQLEKVQSEFQVLEVNLQYGNVVLDSETANYSFGNLHLAFQDAIEYIDFPVNSSQKVLILGFGAGSIAHILKNEYAYHGAITGVEQDPKVIDLAKMYLDKGQFEKVHIEIIDALDYIENAKGKFDFIFIDLFVEQEVPEAFRKTFFFEGCNELLTINGSILMNTMLHQSNATVADTFVSSLDVHGSTDKFEVNGGENRM